MYTVYIYTLAPEIYKLSFYLFIFKPSKIMKHFIATVFTFTLSILSNEITDVQAQSASCYSTSHWASCSVSSPYYYSAGGFTASNYYHLPNGTFSYSGTASPSGAYGRVFATMECTQYGNCGLDEFNPTVNIMNSPGYTSGSFYNGWGTLRLEAHIPTGAVGSASIAIYW